MDSKAVRSAEVAFTEKPTKKTIKALKPSISRSKCANTQKKPPPH